MSGRSQRIQSTWSKWGILSGSVGGNRSWCRTIWPWIIRSRKFWILFRPIRRSKWRWNFVEACELFVNRRGNVWRPFSLRRSSRCSTFERSHWRSGVVLAADCHWIEWRFLAIHDLNKWQKFRWKNFWNANWDSGRESDRDRQNGGFRSGGSGSCRSLSTDDARAALCELPGVGEKIANCVLLFAYDRLDAVPVDVWIARVLNEVYFAGRTNVPLRELKSFAADYFGSYAGYAQQYLFHHWRLTYRRRP